MHEIPSDHTLNSSNMERRTIRRELIELKRQSPTRKAVFWESVSNEHNDDLRQLLRNLQHGGNTKWGAIKMYRSALVAELESALLYHSVLSSGREKLKHATHLRVHSYRGKGIAALEALPADEEFPLIRGRKRLHGVKDVAGDTA